jgi:hypothetical protein
MNRKTTTRTYAVAILDMFHYQDPEHEYEVDGFSSLEHATEYARRRVRDSVEDFRDNGKPENELGFYWHQFGEDAVVLGGNYAGGSELEYFIANPATPEERDWKSIEPPLENTPGLNEPQSAELASRYEQESKAFRRKLVIYFIAFFLLTNISYAISDWSQRFDQWQGITVYYLFQVLSVLCFFGTIFFAIFIFDWFKDYGSANIDSGEDWNTIKLLHKRSLGPIPWK